MMEQNNKRLVFLLLFLVIAVYANSLFGEFLYDDYNLIVRNQYIQNLKFLPEIFQSGFGRLSEKGANYFRPMQEFSYALDFFLYGKNKFGYHITSLWFLIGSVMVLFFLLKELFKDEMLAFLTALLFGVHPIYTSAVTYISGRADIMAIFFLLSCFYVLAKNIDTEPDIWRRGLAASAGLFALAMFSKEVSFVFIAVLAGYFLLRKKKMPAERFKIRFFQSILSFGAIGVLYFSLRAHAISTLFNPQYNIKLPAATRIFTAIKAFAGYLGIIVLPVNLRLLRTLPLAKSFFQADVLLSLLLLVVMAFFAYKLGRRKGPVFCGLLWFFVWYLPVSNFLVPLNSFQAENWTQLPALGIFLAVSALALKLSRTQASNTFLKAAGKAALPMFFLVALFYAGGTVYRNWEYSDVIIFCEHALAREPKSAKLYKLYNNLGQEYSRRNQPEEAIRIYNQALSVCPNDADILNSLANVYFRQGKYEQAFPFYKKAIKLVPGNVMYLNNLGVAYVMNGDKKQAVLTWQKSLKIRPNQPEIIKYIGLNQD